MNNMVMAKRLVAGVTLVLAAMACAMPTKSELARARPIVQGLTADDLNALNANKKKPGDVAAAHLSLADKADTEAGKYLLFQGAFGLYARAGDYDSAADVLQRMRTEISDLPPDVIVEIVSREMRRVAGSRAPKVFAIFKDAQRIVKNRKLLATLEREIKANPNDATRLQSLAECHACLGDWEKALPIFAKLEMNAAKYELTPEKVKDFDSFRAANFWWNYVASDTDPFKAHAAALYRASIDSGVATGLRREIATKRIAELEANSAPVVKETGKWEWAIPANFKEPLVRTLKLSDDVTMDFCAIPAGTFTMGYTAGFNPVTDQWVTYNSDNIEYRHKVTITRPFWMSKHPVTVEQFGAFCPIDDEFIKQNGKQGGPKVPVCLRVAAAEDYCKWLNRRFVSALPRKCIFRLPTDAEWEYALCANSTDADDPYVRFRDNGKRGILREICGEKFPVPVGTAGRPNACGLYDMLGNGCHYVLDTISSAAIAHDSCYGYVNMEKLKCGYKEIETDPLRLYVPNDNKTKACHLMRGGAYAFWSKKKGPTIKVRMAECGEINRHAERSDRPRIWTFRVVIGPDLVAEKNAAAKK